MMRQFLVFVLVWACASSARAGDSLLEFTDQAAASMKVDGAKCAIVESGGKKWLRLAATEGGKGEASIAPATGEWDLSACEGIEFNLRNAGQKLETIHLSAANPDVRGLMNQCQNAVELSVGEEKTFVLRLTRRPEDPGYAVLKPFYMYTKAMNVRDNTVDPAHIGKLVLSVAGPGAAEGVEIASIQTVGKAKAAPEAFFPFIDQYGQYIHGDWPGKIHADEDFAARRVIEEKEQHDWPGPIDRDEWGGWEKGPTLKKTGYFYVTKYEGKWWFVDPAGKLFWSYGPTGVGFGGDVTPITDRLNWFSALPDQNGQFASFFHKGSGATYMYYEHKDWLGIDIQQVNLVRKYGNDYENVVANLSHQRLHSWGFNSIGNWSSPKVYGLHKTPYTVAVHYDSALIHFHMPDVYDPGWEPSVRRRMDEEKGKTVDDPWNIGYFVDNERWFGWRPRGAAIGEETLKNQPARQAKIKFVAMLKEKYKTIDALNAVWKSNHASWDALMAYQKAPDMKNETVLADCGDFGMMFSERYFSVIHDIVKSAAPHNLYLGSRFFGHTDPELVKLASKYYEVISYNIYDNPPDSRVNEYAKLDLPILSSEWGIGSDPMQTPFRDEKLAAESPAARAAKLTGYLEHALRNPNMVGAHFFQYRDQPLSGRPDGEATLRGFVNVADTPNFELVSANRRVAYTMYETRMNAR